MLPLSSFATVLFLQGQQLCTARHRTHGSKVVTIEPARSPRLTSRALRGLHYFGARMSALRAASSTDWKRKRMRRTRLESREHTRVVELHRSKSFHDRFAASRRRDGPSFKFVTSQIQQTKTAAAASARSGCRYRRQFLSHVLWQWSKSLPIRANRPLSTQCLLELAIDILCRGRRATARGNA